MLLISTQLIPLWNTHSTERMRLLTCTNAPETSISFKNSKANPTFSMLERKIVLLDLVTASSWRSSKARPLIILSHVSKCAGSAVQRITYNLLHHAWPLL